MSYAVSFICVCGRTNLQVSVNNAVDMAVMDTLQDLLYAVADGRRTEKETKGRKVNNRRR